MNVRVSHLQRAQFSIQSRSHQILCDQPTDNSGDDQGMTPPELLLASLGSCAAYYAAEYLRTRKLADTGVEVNVTADKLKHPARVGNFRVEVTSPVALTEDQRAAMLRVVHQCLVHNTLMVPPEMSIEVAEAKRFVA
jgi:putative redox protein